MEMPLQATEKPAGAFCTQGATTLAPPYKNSPTAFLELLEAYLRMRDPTEYEFARRYFNSWIEWEVFASEEPFKSMIGGWRKELNQRLKSEALGRILDAARGDTRDALAANKYIYETLDEDKKNKVGRPSKEDILREANRLSEENLRREEAFQRLIGEK